MMVKYFKMFLFMSVGLGVIGLSAAVNDQKLIGQFEALQPFPEDQVKKHNIEEGIQNLSQSKLSDDAKLQLLKYNFNQELQLGKNIIEIRAGEKSRKYTKEDVVTGVIDPIANFTKNWMQEQRQKLGQKLQPEQEEKEKQEIKEDFKDIILIQNLQKKLNDLIQDRKDLQEPNIEKIEQMASELDAELSNTGIVEVQNKIMGKFIERMKNPKLVAPQAQIVPVVGGMLTAAQARPIIEEIIRLYEQLNNIEKDLHIRK